jgi:predicted transcriptional regulator of viral defense system
MRSALLSALKKYPVFSVRDISAVLGRGRPYASLAAFRLKKAGILHELEKGKYTLESDPFLVASWVVWPSYISGWAALNYHKLTEQLPFAIQVMTTRARKNKALLFHGTKLDFTRIQKRAFCGYTRAVYAQNQIFVAEKEKAIVDALASKRMSLPEAVDLVRRNKGKISLRKLLTYSKTSRGLTQKLKGALHD